MSASDKKKLRKEQNAAALTEKQQTEKKQQKKLKAYSVTFVIAMVLIVAIVLVSALQNPVKNMMMKSTIAATVNDHDISSVEFNYYYVDTITNFYSQFSSYGDYADLYMQMMTGFNPSAAVGDQVYNKTTGDTWADYFADSAMASAKWNYAMYDKAMSENYTLSEDEQTALDGLEDNIALYAVFGGFPDAETYLKSMYGGSATMETYLEYYKVFTVAQSYAGKFVDSLEFTDADFRAHEADKYEQYCSFSYATFNLSVSDYLTGGTKTTDENGKETVVYSDDEKAAAQAAAEADAKALLDSKSATLEELNKAIQALEKTKDDATATEATSVLYSSVSQSNEDMKKWITSDERNTGDLNYFKNATTTDGKETVSSYTVVLYIGRVDNTMSVGTIRHLLVAFEKDKDGKLTEKAEENAKMTAEKLLKEFQDGEQTEEAFTKLLKEHTDDVDSNGKPNNDGLYANVTPDSGYVKEFADWATAEHKPGDVEIVKTEYGYHIMYYVEAAELNYRDTLINYDLTEAAYTEWEENLLKTVTVTEGNMKYLNRSYVLSALS